MKRALFAVLAAVMFGVVAVLRRYHADALLWVTMPAIYAMWLLLAFAIPLSRCDTMAQWKLVRQRGRAHYVFARGGWWLALVFFMNPSANFATGGEIRFELWWLMLPLGIVGGPVAHFWEWKRHERKFQEWEKTGPLPEDGCRVEL